MNVAYLAFSHFLLCLSFSVRSELFFHRGGCAQLIDWWQGKQNVLCITGAGLSTESGLADYRGHTGSYHRGWVLWPIFVLYYVIIVSSMISDLNLFILLIFDVTTATWIYAKQTQAHDTRSIYELGVSKKKILGSRAGRMAQFWYGKTKCKFWQAIYFQ